MASGNVNGGDIGGIHGGNNDDPYFISNSDNPNSSLVPVVFTGVNYMRWRWNVLRALGEKNKIGFVDGSIPEPAVNDSLFPKWKRCDYMVMSWLLSSMSADIANDFAYVESAAELWSEIKERFGQLNGPLIYQLKKEINNLKQDNLSILAYYGKMKRLWDEMQSLRCFPTCSCGALAGCSCEFLKKLQDLESEEKLMQFLLGLNGGYDNAITNILTQDPLPSINRAYSIARQIEKQKEYNAVKANKSVGSRMVANVAAKDGMVDSPFDQGNTGDSINSVVVASICITSYALHCGSVKVLNKNLWIVDSGATDHMVFDESILVNKVVLDKSVKVGLPDGSVKYVNIIGTSGVGVVFDTGGCKFQDLTSEKLLAVGQKCGGLCYFSVDHPQVDISFKHSYLA
uniref:Retrotransposon Copia-like N-terminal domain-containing protein n=1 Tax=Chenopodium quinoa TaxID=63459 RepID=A0A803KPU4_CHEQI